MQSKCHPRSGKAYLDINNIKMIISNILKQLNLL